MSDWNAEVYHRVSEPQFRWGLKVLDALDLRGDETVLDAGCGSGRLTELLVERLPRGHVIAADLSEAMLARARATLARFGPRVSFRAVDLADLRLQDACDVVFSTATFHWVLDHPALFRGLHRALRPGGRLHAQCGGEGNLARFHALALGVAGQAPYAPHLAAVGNLWNFAGVGETRERLRAAGFAPTVLELVPAPTPFASRGAFREFIDAVVLRHFVALLPAELKDPFLDAVCDASERSPEPHQLDYVRLELRARSLK